MSLINHLLSKSASSVPEVGMGATQLRHTDRSPWTVVEIVSAREVVVQADQYRRTDRNGLSEDQEYEYTPDPDGAKLTLTARKDGSWRVKGWGGVFVLGSRERYCDPSF